MSLLNRSVALGVRYRIMIFIVPAGGSHCLGMARNRRYPTRVGSALRVAGSADIALMSTCIDGIMGVSAVAVLLGKGPDQSEARPTSKYIEPGPDILISNNQGGS